MAGGDEAPLQALAPVFESLAPEDGWAHVGPSGAGHFTKMVHNGIEYGLMQAYAEGFELMYHSEFELDLSEIAGIWRYGSVVRSWLLELLHAAMRAARRPPRRHRAVRRGLRRGPLDDQRGDQRERARPGDQRRALRPLRLAADEIDFSAKVQAALRNQFGGHAVKAVKAAKATAVSEAREPAPRGPAAAAQPGPVRDRDLRRLRRPDAAEDLSCALLAGVPPPAAGAVRRSSASRGRSRRPSSGSPR